MGLDAGVHAVTRRAVTPVVPTVPRVMSVVVRPYAVLMGVELRRMTRAPDPKAGWTLHPGLQVAYNESQRAVCWFGALGEQRGGFSLAVALAHEVTHCVWPVDPAEMSESAIDSEDEWCSGMMAFEMAWLRRLTPRTTAGNALLRPFKTYASEGMGRGAFLDVAKRTVREHRLPDPWWGSR